MRCRHLQSTAIALCIGLLPFCASRALAAASDLRPMNLGRQVPAPIGYQQFCERQPGDCALFESRNPQVRLKLQIVDGVPALVEDVQPCDRPTPSRVAGISDPSLLLSLAKRTNFEINRRINPRRDRDNYGTRDFWTTPLKNGSGFGDCEDYVLEKRRALIAAGMPRQTLSIALAETRDGTHAVLLVKVADREYVLDNVTDEVLAWNQTTYQWTVRQANGASLQWVVIS